MNVLVVNCGSSSLKFQLINSETEEVAAKGLCELLKVPFLCIISSRMLCAVLIRLPGYGTLSKPEGLLITQIVSSE